MTDPHYTHIPILADRTGSMAEPADGKSGPAKAELTTKGIHDLIAAQKALPGKTTFSLVQFDTMSVDRVAWFTGGDDPKIRDWKIEPRLGTPLLDAVARIIIETGQQLGSLPEDQRPGRVIVVIGTDGEENASREYKLAQVAEMISRQRDVFSWDFVFIGADIDAFAEAGGMGIAMASTLPSSGAHTVEAYAATSDAITRSRGSGQSVSYSTSERRKASGS